MMKYLFLSMLALTIAAPLAVAESNFSRFRGENHDGVVTGETGLLRAWPEEGLKELWRAKLGKGYSSGVIYDEKVYVHDVEKNKDMIRAFDIANGQELWRCTYDSKPHNNQSRANPTVNEGYVATIGSDGTVACVDRKTGKLAWTINLAKDYELAITKEAKSSKLGVYGVSQNPLIDGDAVVIAACTPKALMIKVELATGKILWKTENPKNWTMTFTSITPITFQAGGGQNTTSTPPSKASSAYPPPTEKSSGNIPNGKPRYGTKKPIRQTICR